MEPGTSRETPTDAGCPKPSGAREETPGGEARGRGGSVGMLKPRGVDEGAAAGEVKTRRETESQIVAGEEEDAGKHQEELDPRIQAC